MTSKHFKVGDDVTWNAEAGYTRFTRVRHLSWSQTCVDDLRLRVWLID